MSVASTTWGASQRFRVRPASAKVERVKGVLFYYLLALIFVVFICSLFFIWSRIQIVNLGYSINREISLKEQLQDENKRLNLEAASLKSPLRLESIAKNDFKMDLPQRSQVLSVQIPQVATSNVAPAEVLADTQVKKTEKNLSKSAKKIVPALAKKEAVKNVSKSNLQAKNNASLKVDSKKISATTKKELVQKRDVNSLKVSATKTTQKNLPSKSLVKPTQNASLKSSTSNSSSKKVTAVQDKKTPKIGSIAGISPHR